LDLIEKRRRKVHNEEPYGLYSSPGITGVIESRMRLGRTCNGEIILK
jgi:hypothetical protein